MNQIEAKVQEAHDKERDLRDFAKETNITVTELKHQLEAVQNTQNREFQSLSNRMTQLSEWLKRDSDKLFDQMSKVEKQSNECQDNV